MNRMEQTFRSLRAAGRKALVGYLTAGNPDLAASERDVREAIAQGLDVLELGVPFSDPTADGPAIQAAGRRALDAGTTVGKVLELARRIRGGCQTPIVLFGYANPFFVYGYERLCADAAAAGVDGLLVVDLPFEESGELRPHAEAHGLCLIPLVAPTTPRARMQAVLKGGAGFVYYILVTGVTGERDRLVKGVPKHIHDIRQCTDLPIVVGFGIGTGEQARKAGAWADGVVVGSALVRATAQPGELGRLVRELRSALDRT